MNDYKASLDGSGLHVCLDLYEWVSHPFRGLGQYERHLAKTLLSLDGNEKYYWITPKSGNGLVELTYKNCGKIADFKWSLTLKQRKGLWLFSNRLHFPLDRVFKHIDVFHAPDFIGPWLHDIPLVITVHDMAPWLWRESRTKVNTMYFEWAFPISVQRAERIIVDTESTKTDLLRFIPEVEDKIRVVHLAQSDNYSADARPELFNELTSRLGIHSKYFLAVGTLEPRKNYPLLIEAFRQLINQEVEHCLEMKLLIVGKSGWMYDDIFEQIRKFSLEERIIIVDSLSDDELCQLYIHCLAFVIPSRYEGFGLPVLEAMACGAPVISSNAAALKEVSGDAALTFDLAKPESLVEVLIAILDTNLRQSYRARGLERAKEFSWQKTAKITREIYHQAYDSHQNSPELFS